MAYGRQGSGRRKGPWLEIGSGRLEANGHFRLFLNRTPFPGFDGYVYSTPIGEGPPIAEPTRPADAEEET